MKILKLFITAVFAFILCVTTSAQSNDHMNMNMKAGSKMTPETETFKVWGNCDQCKARIEKAANDEGTTSANWDQKTRMLTVTFNPSKTSVDALSKKLAMVGHDTEKYKADAKAYNALPDCCKYERSAVQQQAYYTCPMHPDVHSDKAGRCPKCGMALVKKEVSKSDATKDQHSMGVMH